MQMIHGIQVTAILRPGIQLGVFDQIANGNNQASSIAAAVGSDERGTRILLDTLIALRLLERDEAHRLTTLADAFLATGRPGYLGGTINIMAAPWIWTAFQNLPEAVRHGGTVLDQPAETPEWQFWETFASSSSAIAIPAAQMLVELLQARTQQRGSLSIPDIACGSGLYSLNSRLNTQRRMPRCSIGPT